MLAVRSSGRGRISPVLVALSLLVGACSSDGGDGSPPRIVVTTTIWADVVDAITCNGLADVTALVSAGGDPHQWSADDDRTRVLEADVVVTNGLGLEGGLRETIDAARGDGIAVIEVAAAIDPLEGADGPDPHVWLDAQRVIGALPDVADAIVDAASLDAAAVEECLNGYLAELAGVDAEVVSILAGVPTAGRGVLATHDSLGYLADRHGFEILGTVSRAGEAGVAPVSFDALPGLLDETGVSVVFGGAELSDDDVQALARRSSALEVVPLRTDSLGTDGEPDDTYFGLLVTVAGTIAAALSSS